MNDEKTFFRKVGPYDVYLRSDGRFQVTKDRKQVIRRSFTDIEKLLAESGTGLHAFTPDQHDPQKKVLITRYENSTFRTSSGDNLRTWERVYLWNESLVKKLDELAARRTEILARLEQEYRDLLRKEGVELTAKVWTAHQAKARAEAKNAKPE